MKHEGSFDFSARTWSEPSPDRRRTLGVRIPNCLPVLVGKDARAQLKDIAA